MLWMASKVFMVLMSMSPGWPRNPQQAKHTRFHWQVDLYDPPVWSALSTPGNYYCHWKLTCHFYFAFLAFVTSYSWENLKIQGRPGRSPHDFCERISLIKAFQDYNWQPNNYLWSRTHEKHWPESSVLVDGVRTHSCLTFNLTMHIYELAGVSSVITQRAQPPRPGKMPVSRRGMLRWKRVSSPPAARSTRFLRQDPAIQTGEALLLTDVQTLSLSLSFTCIYIYEYDYK